MNTHVRNRFQTATATAANTPGLHNNRISARTVPNRLWENGLHARPPYVGNVYTFVLIGHVLDTATLGQTFSQFLLTYGHDFCTKRCIMEHTLNAYITLIPPVCFHQVMFKQS